MANKSIEEFKSNVIDDFYVLSEEKNEIHKNSTKRQESFDDHKDIEEFKTNDVGKSYVLYDEPNKTHKKLTKQTVSESVNNDKSDKRDFCVHCHIFCSCESSFQLKYKK